MALLVTVSAGCLAPVQNQPPPQFGPDCPISRAPPVPIQLNVSNWTAGIVTYTVWVVCGLPTMMPANLTYIVKSANGTVFLEGPAATGLEVLGARVTLAFTDANATGWVDRGDTFTLSVDPPEGALLLAAGRVTAFNDSRHSNSVGLADIPFPATPHVGLSISSHSGNISTLVVTSVENLPPFAFDDIQILIFSQDNTSLLYLGPPKRAWPANVSYRDTNADGAFSAGDTLVVSVDPSQADEMRGGRLEVSFFLHTVGILEPLP